MSSPCPPDPAKLVIGVFLKNTDRIDGIASGLTAQFGPIDFVSPWLDFDYTDYYQAEFGRPLFRRIFTFEKLISQSDLASIKVATNSLETGCAQGGKRQVNIDPGYMLKERFVLATGKNFAHRIYIGQGIYADLTLIFQKKAFRALPWTYPDYKSSSLNQILEQIREKYLADLKQIPPNP